MEHEREGRFAATAAEMSEQQEGKVGEGMWALVGVVGLKGGP
jgi:hypothetical protein